MENRTDYLHRRAREEDAAASRASSDNARQVHLELAIRYRDAAGTGQESDGVETVSSTAPKDFRILY